MEIVIRICCDNAAFEDRGAEIARILRVVARHANATPDLLNGWKLHDINGNTVGVVEVHL